MLVGNDTGGLSIELLDHLESKLHQVGLAVLASVVEDSIWGVIKDPVNELVAESLPDIGRGPEQPDWDTAFEGGVGTGANTGTSGDKDHPVEYRSDPQDTVSRKTTDS